MKTIGFYLTIIILSTLFAKLAETVRPMNSMSIKTKGLNPLFVILSMGVLFFVIAFATEYSDYSGYETYYTQSAHFSQYAMYYIRNMRIGWFAFNAIIHLITDSFTEFTVCWAIVIIVLSFVPLVRLHNEIPFALSVFVLSSLYLLHGISAKRFQLSMSIILFASYYFFKGENKKFLVCILLAAMIHPSALIMILFWGATSIFNSSFYKHNPKIVFIFAVFAVFTIILLRSIWVGWLIKSGYEKYEYLSIPIGIGYLLYWLPSLLIYFFTKPYLLDKVKRQLFLITICCTMAITIMGYMAEDIARINEFLCYKDIVFIPYAIKNSKAAGALDTFKMSNQRGVFIEVCFVILVLVEFVVFMQGKAITSGLIPYVNIFGWRI